MDKMIYKAVLGLFSAGALSSVIASTHCDSIAHGFFFGGGASAQTSVAEVRVRGTDKVADVSNAHPSYFSLTENRFPFGLGTGDVRLAPMLQAGYWAPVDNHWLWGLKLAYEHLNYRSPVKGYQSGSNSRTYTEDDDRGKLLVFGITHINLEHSLSMLAYAGMRVGCGYAYLGAGPAVSWLEMKVIDQHATSDSQPRFNLVNKPTHWSRTLLSGALQLGIAHYLMPTWFVDFHYTYVFKAKGSDIKVKGSDVNDDGEELPFKVESSAARQEVVVSLNKVFE